MPKYQGKEFTTTLQAPTRKQLDKLIRGNMAFARRQGMEDIRILERGKDPDGGYRAILVAHNWNPIEWVKEKVSSLRGRGESTEEPRVEYSEPAPETVNLGREEEKRQGKKKRLPYTPEYEPEDITLDMRMVEPPPEREDYAKESEFRKAYDSYAKRVQEAVERKESMEREERESFERTGRLKEEALAEAELTKAKTLKAELEAEKLRKEVKPTVGERIMKGLPGIGRGLGAAAGEATKGIAAGAQKGLAPGKAGPQRAARMVVPQVGPSLFAIPKMGLGMGKPNLGLYMGTGLGALRTGMTMPGLRAGLLSPLPRMGQPAIQTTTEAKVPGLSDIQSRVYTAITEGNNTKEVLVNATGLLPMQVGKAVKDLEKKGMIKTDQGVIVPVVTQQQQQGRISPLGIPRGGMNLSTMIPRFRR
jgi:hypothetical protein